MTEKKEGVLKDIFHMDFFLSPGIHRKKETEARNKISPNVAMGFSTENRDGLYNRHMCCFLWLLACVLLFMASERVAMEPFQFW